MSQMIFTALRIPDAVVKLIDECAEDEGIIRSAVIRRWIYDALDLKKPGRREHANRVLFGPSIAPSRAPRKRRKR